MSIGTFTLVYVLIGCLMLLMLTSSNSLQKEFKWWGVPLVIGFYPLFVLGAIYNNLKKKRKI